MEDDLKKIKKIYLFSIPLKFKIRNGRRPKKNKKMEDDLKKNKKMEDDLKKSKNLFSIPYKFREKPFLGLAQLSKIFQDII